MFERTAQTSAAILQNENVLYMYQGNNKVTKGSEVVVNEEKNRKDKSVRS